jgi:hypothetical protein
LLLVAEEVVLLVKMDIMAVVQVLEVLKLEQVQLQLDHTT